MGRNADFRNGRGVQRPKPCLNTCELSEIAALFEKLLGFLLGTKRTKIFFHVIFHRYIRQSRCLSWHHFCLRHPPLTHKKTGPKGRFFAVWTPLAEQNRPLYAALDASVCCLRKLRKEAQARLIHGSFSDATSKARAPRDDGSALAQSRRFLGREQ